MAGVRVTHQLKELWSVSTEKLKEIALENLKQKAIFTIYEMERILSEYSGYRIPGMKKTSPELYVLTDSSRKNGPAALLFPEILKSKVEA